LGLRNGSGKRGPAPKFQKQLERIAQLPRAHQQVVMDMLDGILAQPSRRASTGKQNASPKPTRQNSR
jgi:hypothetical protein